MNQPWIYMCSPSRSPLPPPSPLGRPRGLYFFILHTSSIFSLLVSHVYPKYYRFMKLFNDPTLNPTKSNSWSNILLGCKIDSILKKKNPLTAKIACQSPYSIVLVATVLKLGGPGMLQITMILYPLTNHIAYPLLILGIIITSSIWLHQTDLKSLTMIHSPHSTCHHSYPHPNTSKLFRGHCPSNRPWPHVIYIILPGKFKLQMYSEPNHNFSLWPTDLFH